MPYRSPERMRSIGLATILMAAGTFGMAAESPPVSLEGTWVMTSAYEILADGTRTTNYGEHPNGLLTIDKVGRYSIQIFRPDRPKFASGDKKKAHRKNTPRPFWVPDPYRSRSRRSDQRQADFRYRRRLLSQLGGNSTGARLHLQRRHSDLRRACKCVGQRHDCIFRLAEGAAIARASPTLIAIQFCNFSALAVFCQQESNTSTLARRHTWTP